MQENNPELQAKLEELEHELEVSDQMSAHEATWSWHVYSCYHGAS